MGYNSVSKESPNRKLFPFLITTLWTQFIILLENFYPDPTAVEFGTLISTGASLYYTSHSYKSTAIAPKFSWVSRVLNWLHEVIFQDVRFREGFQALKKSLWGKGHLFSHYREILLEPQILIKFHIIKIQSCLQTQKAKFYLPGKIKLKGLHYKNNHVQPEDEGEGLHPPPREACFLTSARERVMALTHVMPTQSSYLCTKPVNGNCSLGNVVPSQAGKINSTPCHLCLVLHQKPGYFCHGYKTHLSSQSELPKILSLLSAVTLLQQCDSSL